MIDSCKVALTFQSCRVTIHFPVTKISNRQVKIKQDSTFVGGKSSS